MTDALARLTAALADRYRIERELGAGGMATVYLAQDLKHDRRVAIKVLRPELAAVIGAGRFLREIKTIANLSHPHILGLIDSGEVDGTAYYVMPFVDGESLRDRLEREKQLPIADAVRLATEMAAALDYAHRHDVIHRDIKPENILLHDGRALVADFGIALAASKSGATRMTETGMSLGTPTYMSPEQAMGEREISARSDVYALACVTYEMLVGDPPFVGSTAQAIVAKVMTEKPTPPSRVRDTVTEAIDDAVLTGLAKLPADRFATAAEFATALGRGGSAALKAEPVSRRAAPYVALALVTALAAWGWLRHRAAPTSPGMIRATIELGDSARIRPIGNLRLALSPDGRYIAFVGVDGNHDALFIRAMSSEKVRKLTDTRGAFAPFFSPDSRSLGFFTLDAGRSALRTVSVDGGTVTTIAVDSLASFGGGSWGDDGNIYFTHSSRALARMPAKGGTITIIARPDSSTGVKEYDYPDVLPGSRQALVMLWKGSLGTNRVGIIDLRSGAVTDLSSGSYPRFVNPGSIAIAGSAGRIMVARLDAAGRTLRDVPTTIIEDAELDLSNGTVQFAVAGNGILVYQRRGPQGSAVVYVDRAGNRTPVDTTLKGTYQSLALSPNGQQLALSQSVPDGIEIWLKQLTTGTYVRLSGDKVDADRPVWTPDGRAIAFLATGPTGRTAFIRRADGSDSSRRVSPGNFDEIWFDRTMRHTIFRTVGAGIGTRSLLVLETGVDSAPRSLLSARFDHAAMMLSPDGRWLAFVSDESGAKEVYVRPFPDVQSAKYPISALGGIEPVWSRDGKELFFRNPADGAMYSVTVAGGSEFTRGPPRRLFDAPEMIMQEYYRSYDVTPDGKRFVMLSAGTAESHSLRAIFNWQPVPGSP